jgi:hypothetical protein
MDHLKILGAIATITFIVQILFSFYYSSEIITQNLSFANAIQHLEQISSINNQLKIEYSHLTALEHLRQQIKDQPLLPIKNIFNITQ